MQWTKLGRQRKGKAKRGLVCSADARASLAANCRAEHGTEERKRGEEFGLQWAKTRKKGLLVIIKSSRTDFLPNLFPRGPELWFSAYKLCITNHFDVMEPQTWMNEGVKGENKTVKMNMGHLLSTKSDVAWLKSYINVKSCFGTLSLSKHLSIDCQCSFLTTFHREQNWRKRSFNSWNKKKPWSQWSVGSILPLTVPGMIVLNIITQQIRPFIWSNDRRWGHLN